MKGRCLLRSRFHTIHPQAATELRTLYQNQLYQAYMIILHILSSPHSNPILRFISYDIRSSFISIDDFPMAYVMILVFLIVTTLLQGNPVAVPTWSQIWYPDFALPSKVRVPHEEGYFTTSSPWRDINFEGILTIDRPRSIWAVPEFWRRDVLVSSTLGSRLEMFTQLSQLGQVNLFSWLGILAFLALLRSHLDDPPWNVMDMLIRIYFIK